MNNFIYPQYNGNSLLNVPSTILRLFGAKILKKILPKNYYQRAMGCEKVILLLIDGLGDNLFQKKATKYSFFKKLKESGSYAPITSVFPSTTAAATSTINSGLSPLEHGLPEWYVYFEELGIVIQTLPYLPALEKDRDKLSNPKQDMLFEAETIYQKLQKVGVKSFVFLHKSYLDSPYNVTASKGAEVITYRNLAEFMVYLAKAVSSSSGPAYFYVYWAAVDSAEHNFGPESELVEVELSLLSYMLQNEFISKIDSDILKKTAVILTSDHGQVSTDPKTTLYLDRVEGFIENLNLSPDGNIIPPWGGPRDVFVKIRPDKLEATFKLLEKELEGKAQILRVDDVIAKGIFGEGKMHPKFKSRVGDILILPYDDNSIWYHYTEDADYEKLGHHGGLTEEEMMIPYVCAELSDLKI